MDEVRYASKLSSRQAHASTRFYPSRFKVLIRLGAADQAGAFHCLRLPIPDVGRRAVRAIAICPSQTSVSTLNACGLTTHHHCSELGLVIDRRLCLTQATDHLLGSVTPRHSAQRPSLLRHSQSRESRCGARRSKMHHTYENGLR